MFPSKKLFVVAFVIVTVEIITIIFLIYITRNKISENLIAQKIKTEQTIVSQLSKSLKNDLSSVESMLNLIALNPEIQSDRANDCQKKLSQVFPVIEKKIANLVRINKEGTIYCAVNRASIGIDVLKNQDLNKFIKSPEHKPILHRIVLSPVSNKYVAGLHVPVLSVNGEFKGSIGGVIYFDELKEKYFKDFKLLETGYLILIDDNGDILYHQKSPDFVGKNLLSEETLKLIPEREGYKKQVEEVLVNIRQNKPSFVRSSFKPYPEMVSSYYPVEIFSDRHWAVVVTVPVKEIENQVDESSFISGFKNFTILTLAMISIILITQIMLFFYLIKHVSDNIKKKFL